MKGARPLNDEEVAAVLASFAGRDRLRNVALFVLGVRTGYRISELLSLTIGDVSHDGRVLPSVTVQRRNMKKKMEGRTVVLHAKAQAALAEWVAALASRGCANPKGPLFASRQRGRALSRVQAWQVFRDAYDAIGLTGKLGTHAMRKTFAARVYARLGKDIIQTQRALGHKNVSSTASYLSFDDEKVNRAILED